MPPLRSAVLLADPETARALVGRFHGDVLDAAAEGLRLPRTTVAALAERGDLDLADALTHPASAAVPFDLLLAAARLGDSATAAALHEHRTPLTPEQNERLTFAILDHADTGDEGYAQHPVGRHLKQLAYDHGPYLALRAPFAYYAYARAGFGGGDLPLPAVLTLSARLAELAGPRGLLELVDHAEREPGSEGALDLNRGHPGMSAVLREAAAAPDPAAHLTARRDEALAAPGMAFWAHPEAVATVYRLRNRSGRPLPDPGIPLDWDALRAEFARRPLSETSLPGLSQLPGVPDDLLTAAFEAAPNYVIDYVERLPDGLHTWVPDRPGRYLSPYHLVRQGLAKGLYEPARLFAEYSPGRTLLEAMPYELPAVREAVATTFAVLGADPVAWLTLYTRLSHANGTVTDLLDDVAERLRTKPVRRWPRPLQAKIPASEPDNARQILTNVLGCMPDAVTAALAPHLDARAVQHLLAYGNVSAVVRDALVAAHGPEALAWWAACETLPDADVEWLLTQDDPAADANLFLYGGMGADDRVRLLAGRRRDGGLRDRVPDQLLSALHQVNLGHYRSHLTAGIGSGDPGVAAVLVERLRFHTDAGPLRLALAVWERAGAGALRDLADSTDRLPAKTRNAVAKALEADDADVLRAALAAAEEPETVLRQLARRSRSSAELAVKSLLNEGGSLPWAQIGAQAATLPRDLVDVLGARADAPREVLLALLPRLPEGWAAVASTWVAAALKHGTLRGGDVLAHAPFPAQVERLFTGFPDAVRRAPLREARALAARYLGADTEAWAVAMQLAPDFTGTVEDLFAVSAAATA